ncbi:hypothetical protein MBLNU13_g00016t2 [Cladosporium sp. NU13]
MKEAEEMYLRALRGYEEAWGAKHTSTLQTVNNLGNLYKDQARTHHILETQSRLRISFQVNTGRYSSRKRILPLIIDLSTRYSFSNTFLLGVVGRALLWTGDDENAQIAFQNQITKIGDVWSHGRTFCDGCKETLTLDTGRYVCMACSDVDLCEACYRVYDVSDTVEEAAADCSGHEFLVIAQHDPHPTMSSSDQRLSDWMRQLLQRYPIASELERS